MQAVKNVSLTIEKGQTLAIVGDEDALTRPSELQAIVNALPPEAVRELDETVRLSAANTGLRVCLAINYGGRTEIVDACRALADKVRRGELAPDQIDDDAHLYLLERPFARWPIAAPLIVLAALFGLIMFLEWLEMAGKGAA